MTKTVTDVAIIGAGHNGLVAAVMLARHGLTVSLFEELATIGGAVKPSILWQCPEARRLVGRLSVRPHATRADRQVTGEIHPHPPRSTLLLPTTDCRYLLFGSDVQALRQQFLTFFSERDWNAHQALTREIAHLREDLAPSWLEEPLSVYDTAAKYLRPALGNVHQSGYTSCGGLSGEVCFAASSLLAIMRHRWLPGLHGGFGTSASGMNFLVHNMCRLPGSDGTWMIAKGGMGSITKELARLATEAGARIWTGASVQHIITQGEQVVGVVLRDGREIDTHVAISNADPFLHAHAGGPREVSSSLQRQAGQLPAHWHHLKVNLALDRLPTFQCLPTNCGQHHATIHLLPQGQDVISHIRHGFEKVQAGELADFPPIEWYIHTPADPSLQDDQGRHSAAFFVQWVPYELKDKRWEDEEGRYVRHLLSIADQFAPGFGSSVVDVFTLTPKKIEQHFGISYGHIHHVDNTFGFDQRMPYVTPIAGLYSCSAGCHPAGSVIGAAGHNAAMRVLKDLGVL
jgi:phytoene dehydrogenase-like protein